MIDLSKIKDETLYTLEELAQETGIPKKNLQIYIREKGLKAITVNKFQHIAGVNFKNFLMGKQSEENLWDDNDNVPKSYKVVAGGFRRAIPVALPEKDAVIKKSEKNTRISKGKRSNKDSKDNDGNG